MFRVLMTKPRASTIRASGRPSAISKCGRRWSRPSSGACVGTYTNPIYPYVQPPELAGAKAKPRPGVIVGAGPVGLSAAIDLAQQDIPVLVLDDDNTVS